MVSIDVNCRPHNTVSSSLSKIIGPIVLWFDSLDKIGIHILNTHFAKILFRDHMQTYPPHFPLNFASLGTDQFGHRENTVTHADGLVFGEQITTDQ